MIPATDLLTKSVYSLYSTTAIERASSSEIDEALEPQQEVSSSLVFLSPDFKLTDEEEVLLKDMIHRSKLTPNLTLFDLLFF